MNPRSLSGSLVFKTSSLSHSDTSPDVRLRTDWRLINLSYLPSGVNTFLHFFKNLKNNAFFSDKRLKTALIAAFFYAITI